MASTSSPTDSPSFGLSRRKSQVFVQIPPSPLFKARVASTMSKVDDLSALHVLKGHKENAPPLSTKTSTNNIPTDNKNKSKRKAQDDDDRATLPGAKKAKVPQSDNESEIVACHQCRAKKHVDSVLQCTGTSKKTRNRCRGFYCDTCFRNRYGKELKAIAKRKSSESREGNSDLGYHFICPRCDGNCNCAPCRKRKGLAPVGKFSAQSGESVREILEKNPEASGRLPKHTVIPAPKAPKPSKADASAEAVVPGDEAQGSAKVPRKKGDIASDAKKKKKPKAVPEPVWVPVPDMRSKEEIEDRIHLREFVLRFNPILNIGVRNLEELDDFTSMHDPSTKAILLSLLDLLAIEDDSQKKRVQEKVKIIRSLGLNWAKIVPVLYDLRNTMPKDHPLSAIPDLGQSDIETSYNMRRARMQNVSADQLLPVLLYLIQFTGEGASVRQELEEGYKQAKEVRAAYYKALREETERWATERAELTEEKPGADDKTKTKESRDAWKVKFRDTEAEHKTIVANIQHSQKPEMDCSAPRFTSLGCDTDGRTYYALSASGPQRGKKERVPSDSERLTMKRWGWFIAVYGKPGSVVQHGSEDDTDEDEDESRAERWWGFADVEEIRKLSKWLAYCAEADSSKNTVGDTRSAAFSAEASATSSTLTSRLPSPSGTTAISRSETRPVSPTSDLSDSRSDEDREHDVHLAKSATSAGMKALAKAILEFADFIDWRLNRDQTTSQRPGSDAVAPARFN